MLILTYINSDMYSIEDVCDGKSISYRVMHISEISQSLKVVIFDKILSDELECRSGSFVSVSINDLSKFVL